MIWQNIFSVRVNFSLFHTGAILCTFFAFLAFDLTKYFYIFTLQSCESSYYYVIKLVHVARRWWGCEYDDLSWGHYYSISYWRKKIAIMRKYQTRLNWALKWFNLAEIGSKWAKTVNWVQIKLWIGSMWVQISSNSL